MARSTAVVRVNGRRKAETGKALLLEVDTGSGSTEQVWVPLSTVHEIQDDHVLVDEWIAKERGLI